MFLDYYAHALITYVSCDLFDPDIYSEQVLHDFFHSNILSPFLSYIYKTIKVFFWFWLTNKTMFVIHYQLKNYEIIEADDQAPNYICLLVYQVLIMFATHKSIKKQGQQDQITCKSHPKKTVFILCNVKTKNY